MAQHGAYEHGHMNITDQKDTFHGFLSASVWTGALIAQSVLLLTLSFAMGYGWWPGFFAFVVVGIAVGFIFKMPSVYWAVQVALWVLMGIGGMLVPALTGG